MKTLFCVEFQPPSKGVLPIFDAPSHRGLEARWSWYWGWSHLVRFCLPKCWGIPFKKVAICCDFIICYSYQKVKCLCLKHDWNNGRRMRYTAWKLPKYGVFSGPYFPVFGLNTGNTDQKKLRIWTLFTQWYTPSFCLCVWRLFVQFNWYNRKRKTVTSP